MACAKLGIDIEGNVNTSNGSDSEDGRPDSQRRLPYLSNDDISNVDIEHEE